MQAFDVTWWSSADTVLQGEESKAKSDEQVKAKQKSDMPHKDGACIPALGFAHWQLRRCSTSVLYDMSQ